MHLVMIFGPQAVGKMAVGREIARLTPYRLLHNHATIEVLLDVFEHGTAGFEVLNEEFRRRIIEEAVVADLPGLVFTYVWGLGIDSETRYVERLVAPVLEAGGSVDFVELQADEATRLAREGTPLRLAVKPSKRDVAWQRAHLVEWGALYELSTGPDVPFPLEHPHTVIDNADLSAADAALEVVRRLDLPRR